MPEPTCSGNKYMGPSKLVYQFPTSEEAKRNKHQYYVNILATFKKPKNEPKLTSAHVSIRKSKERNKYISRQSHLTVFRGANKYHVYFYPDAGRYVLKAREDYAARRISAEDTLFKTEAQIMVLARAVLGDMIHWGKLPNIGKKK